MQTNKTKLKLNPQVLLRRPERFLQDLQDFLQRIPARLRNDSETKDDSATKTGWFWNQNRWFCNQEWFWNQKKGFWNQGWFRNQGHLETKMAWFSNEAVCISFFFEASSWLCHLDTCLTLLSHPTPPPPHPETMPCWVWLQVCQRKERSCQDVIIPPHPAPPPRIWDDAMLSVAASVSGRNAAARTSLSHPTTPHPPASGDDAMLSVAASVSKEGTQLPGRYYPTPPHPTPLHLETMPCWVWLQVCQRKERSCQDVIIPPHPTVSGESHPTPPHPPASGDDAMLSVAASVSKEGTQLPGRYYPTPPHRIWRWCHVECGRKCVKGRNAAARTLFHPTPPHPPASGDDAMLTVAASVTRMLVSESRGWWLRNRLFLVAKSLCFGCGIAFFWLRNRLFCGCGIVSFWLRKRLFLVAEACLILVAESPKFGCGSVEIWFRNRNLFFLQGLQQRVCALEPCSPRNSEILELWNHGNLQPWFEPCNPATLESCSSGALEHPGTFDSLQIWNLHWEPSSFTRNFEFFGPWNLGIRKFWVLEVWGLGSWNCWAPNLASCNPSHLETESREKLWTLHRAKLESYCSRCVL